MPSTPRGLRAARRLHRDRWTSSYAEQNNVSPEEARAAYAKAHPRASLSEEGFATFAGELTGYFELLSTPEGKKHVQRLAEGSPSLLRRIFEAVGRIFGRKPELERLLDRLAVSVDKRKESAEAALAIADMFERGPVEQAEAPAIAATPKYAPRAGRKADMMEKLDLPPETRLEALRRLLVDKNARLRDMVSELATLGGVTEDTDVRIAIDLLDGRIENRLTQFKKKRIDVITELMKKNGISLEEGGRFLYVRHVPEANRVGQEKFPDGKWNAETNPFSGLATSQAESERDAFEARQGFKQLGKEVDAMTRETRATLLEYGLISQEQHDSWDAMFDHYVPLMDPEGENDSPFPLRSAGYQTRGPEARERKGGRTSEVDPSATLVWAIQTGQQRHRPGGEQLRRQDHRRPAQG